VDIQIQQILTQIVGFILLLWLMRRWAWKPLLKTLDDRRSKITSEWTEIKATKETIGQLQRDYETRLLEIEKQARAKMQEAIGAGEQTGREIANQARKQAEEILVKAKENIEREVVLARTQIRNEVAMLAIAAAEKVIRKEMNTAKNKELVLQYVDELR
jgi:F-type H+-transporting ATPase subunit b